MSFILVYAVFISTALTGFAGAKASNAYVQPIRDGKLPPIVVPEDQHIPWLTEKTKRDYAAYLKTHKAEGK